MLWCCLLMSNIGSSPAALQRRALDQVERRDEACASANSQPNPMASWRLLAETLPQARHEAVTD